MIRKILCLIPILLTYVISPIISQDLMIVNNYFSLNPGWDVLIQANQAVFKNYNDPDTVSKINLANINKTTFITFLDQGPSIIGFNSLSLPSKQLWLTLIDYSPEMLITYDSDNSNPKLFNYSSNYSNFNDGVIFTSSSKYHEGNKTYYANNLSNLKLTYPWVEDKPGYGLGETITIKASIGKLFTLYLSNGYVSYTKPQLYTDNTRVKRIEITSKELDKPYVVTIEDSPNIQKIELPNSCKEIVITIMDIYPGDKYEDTCINFILTEVR